MLPLTFIGDSVLHKKTTEIPAKEFKTAKIQTFAKELLESVQKYPAAGLAAPQVGKSLRIFSLILEKEYLTYKLVKTTNKGLKGELMKPDIPLLVINPVLERITTDIEYSEEACLSIPHYYGIVGRDTHIKLSFVDLDNNSYTIAASGFMARVIQHEFDHVNGILWLDRIRSTKDIFFDVKNAFAHGF